MFSIVFFLPFNTPSTGTWYGVVGPIWVVSDHQQHLSKTHWNRWIPKCRYTTLQKYDIPPAEKNSLPTSVGPRGHVNFQEFPGGYTPSPRNPKKWCCGIWFSLEKSDNFQVPCWFHECNELISPIFVEHFQSTGPQRSVPGHRRQFGKARTIAILRAPLDPAPKILQNSTNKTLPLKDPEKHMQKFTWQNSNPKKKNIYPKLMIAELRLEFGQI